ncbi:MAG: DNA-processing protein DprA [Candidatus Ventricola sp.]
MNESEAMAVLVSARGISYLQRERALASAGSALALLGDVRAFERELGAQGTAGLRTAIRQADRMLDRLWEDGVRLIVRGGEGYPERLARTARPPHLLFCLGCADLGDPFPIAVVGTRRADSYGLRHTRALARELARRGMCIVSGLALGVDACAHWGALDGQGRTIAVLGGALDRMYPAENEPLMRRILEAGGSVVSEYAPGTAPTRYSFVQRNRIVAGLSLGVLVTQAPYRSGAQSTVQFALEEGREVFAMPGDIDRLGSQLPNQLIGEGARPVTCAQDVTALLVIEPGRRDEEREPEPQQIALRLDAPKRKLDSREQAVCELLRAGDLDFDALSERTGISSDELGSLLMMLELDGIVAALPGAMYRLA